MVVQDVETYEREFKRSSHIDESDEGEGIYDDEYNYVNDLIERNEL